jgi:hypothetical protein
MASPFTLPRPAGGIQAKKVSEQPQTPVPVYEIWSRRLGKKVGEVTTREGATRAVDRRDSQYGASDHYFKRAGE